MQRVCGPKLTAPAPSEQGAGGEVLASPEDQRHLDAFEDREAARGLKVQDWTDELLEPGFDAASTSPLASCSEAVRQGALGGVPGPSSSRRREPRLSTPTLLASISASRSLALTTNAQPPLRTDIGSTPSKARRAGKVHVRLLRRPDGLCERLLLRGDHGKAGLARLRPPHTSPGISGHKAGPYRRAVPNAGGCGSLESVEGCSGSRNVLQSLG